MIYNLYTTSFLTNAHYISEQLEKEQPVHKNEMNYIPERREYRSSKTG